MSDMKHSGGSAITRRSRRIKAAPMTRAVRVALAASVAALALGTSHGAFAANAKAPAHGAMPFSTAAIDATPVVDLTVVHAGPHASTSTMFAALAIEESGAGDVVIDNPDPITEIGLYDTTTISGYSSGGNVGITNQAAADLYAGSVYGSAIGIYAYSAAGTANVDNAADIAAISYYGIADGIFAAGVDIDVTNSGAIEATSVHGVWAAGIEAEGTDLTTVQNDGDIHAAASSPGSWAFGIYATGAEVEIGNTGSIEAQGYYATGIGAQSAGDVTVANDGGIVAGTPYYSVLATGIDAASNGDEALVTVANNGDVLAQAYYGGTGIAATASGVGGSASVTNTGAIHASQYNKYGYGAYGIVATADADSAIDNSGTIEVGSGGVANGAAAFSYAGDSSVTNSGDIEVTSTALVNYGASGIVAFAANGDAHANNSGSVSAISDAILYTSARAVDAQGQQSVTVVNSGSLYANGAAAAYSIYALSTGGDVAVTNAQGGGIGFYSYAGGGFGVLAVAGDEANIDNAGTIDGYAYGQSAGIFGFSYAGDANASNSGSISVATGSDVALGIFARADYGNASIDNSGDIQASTEGVDGYNGYAAYGAFARGGYAEVSNSGDIVALGTLYATGIAATSLYGTIIDNAGGSIYVGAPGGLVSYYGYYQLIGSASGISAQSVYGNVTVTNASDITAISAGAADVAGITVTGTADIAVANSGDITASTLYGQGYGINAATYSPTDGTTIVNNSGDITLETPYSPFGHSSGISAFRQYDGDVVVGNSGDIDIQAGGRSYGVYAHTKYGDVSVNNSGDMTMLSQTDAQSGIQTSAGSFFGGGGDASVVNTGNISINSGYGLAVGIGAIAGSALGTVGNSYINNSGDIDATAERFAYGLQARGAASATIVNTGDLTASTSKANNYYNPSTAGGISILSFSGGDLVIQNAGNITVDGYEDAHGFYANGGGAGDVSIVNAGDLSVHTQTTIARGVIAQSYYGDITVDNSGSILATGSDASAASVGIHLSGLSGDVVVNNAGDIHAEGSLASIGVLFQTISSATTLNNASTGSISADGAPGYAWAVMGSYYAADTINNAGLIDGSIYLNGGDDVINNLAGGTLLLDDAKILMGSSIVGNVFENAGTIKALGDSVIDMGSGDAVALVPSLNPLPLVNTGSIDLLDGAADDGLTIVGDLGGKGALDIDVSVPDNVADRLLVDGSIADDAVQIVNLAFQPSLLAAAQSGGTTDFAWVSGDSTAGSFVGGQVIGYDAGNFLSLGVVVTSSINAANTTDDVFSVGVSVDGLNDTGTLAADAASGAAGMLNAQVGTFKQRMGVNPYGDAGKIVSAFFRTYTSEGEASPAHASANIGQGGNFDYDQSVWGREVGVNANLFGNVHAGLVLGTADGRQRLTGDGIGSNRMDGMTWGLYATWFAPQGFYIDVSGRWMAVDIVSTSAAGQLANRAHTGAWNIEAGYEWKLGGLSIVPQLQYTRTEVDGISAIHSDSATFESHGGTSSRGRVGVEASKTFQSNAVRWTPYGSINAVREFDGDMDYTAADTFSGSTSTKGTSTMAELGLGVQAGGWGFTLGANWVDGGAFKHTVGGQAVVRFGW